MASTKFTLDTRRKKRDGTFPLKVNISHNNSTSQISLGISLKKSQWNEKQGRVKAHPNGIEINEWLDTLRNRNQLKLMAMSSNGELCQYKTATALRNALMKQTAASDSEEENRAPTTPVFKEYYYSYLEKLRISESTRQEYLTTLRTIEKILPSIATVTLDDITFPYITEIEDALTKRGMKVNSIATYISRIRAVYNEGLREGVISTDVFKHYRVKKERTRSRALAKETLKRIFALTPQECGDKYIYVATFKLSFLLCGISPIDLLHLEEIDYEGYVIYNRAKTSIVAKTKVPPEALPIIEEFRGEKYLLSHLEKYSTYDSFLQKCTRELKRLNERIEGAPLPPFTMYYARHSWATIAGELEVPEIIIDASQGRVNNSITSVYARISQPKQDEVNRRVIDFVLYS